MLVSTPKDEITKRLRQVIQRQIFLACETDDAEAFLSALSFQSKLYPERYIWIDTDFDGIGIDLEDLSLEDEEHEEGEWDDAVARLKARSLEEAVEITSLWLSGANLSDWYTNVNQQYLPVQKKIASPVKWELHKVAA